MKSRIALWLSLTLTTGALVSDAQQTNLAVASDPLPVAIKKPEELKIKHQSFTFIRIKYSGVRGRVGSWYTDFPDADLNFTMHFQESIVPAMKSDLDLQWSQDQIDRHTTNNQYHLAHAPSDQYSGTDCS